MSKPIEYGRPWWEVMKEVSEENARLKAEVERLRKAGDDLADEVIGCYNGEGYDPADSESLRKWNAAKEGKPSV